MELAVGAIAHGGHCVARAPHGRVVFVRHALPGERVLATVTEERPGYLRADTIAVRETSPDRVPPPCPWAGSAAVPTDAAAGLAPACGGCDFQHVTPAAQRRLKAAV